jgi:excisionase family DNA binding protein
MTEHPKEILTIDEACVLLGVSAKTFAKILREEDIPGRKIGREWKFSRQALIDWVGSGKARDFIDRSKRKRRGSREENGQPAPQERAVKRRMTDRFSIEED